MENDQLRNEYSKINQLRAAYNADKSAFNEKIENIERKMRE
jgi:hypothetical protein